MATDSNAATTIAAGPPYKRKVRNTAASEKLIAKRDRGKVKLIRGPTKVENARTMKNPELIVSPGKAAKDNAMQIAPDAIVTAFVMLE